MTQVCIVAAPLACPFMMSMCTTATFTVQHQLSRAYRQCGNRASLAHAVWTYVMSMKQKSDFVDLIIHARGMLLLKRARSAARARAHARTRPDDIHASPWTTCSSHLRVSEPCEHLLVDRLLGGDDARLIARLGRVGPRMMRGTLDHQSGQQGRGRLENREA